MAECWWFTSKTGVTLKKSPQKLQQAVVVAAILGKHKTWLPDEQDVLGMFTCRATGARYLVTRGGLEDFLRLEPTGMLQLRGATAVAADGLRKEAVLSCRWWGGMQGVNITRRLARAAIDQMQVPLAHRFDPEYFVPVAVKCKVLEDKVDGICAGVAAHLKAASRLRCSYLDLDLKLSKDGSLYIFACREWRVTDMPHARAVSAASRLRKPSRTLPGRGSAASTTPRGVRFAAPGSPVTSPLLQPADGAAAPESLCVADLSLESLRSAHTAEALQETRRAMPPHVGWPLRQGAAKPSQGDLRAETPQAAPDAPAAPPPPQAERRLSWSVQRGASGKGMRRAASSSLGRRIRKTPSKQHVDASAEAERASEAAVAAREAVERRDAAKAALAARHPFAVGDTVCVEASVSKAKALVAAAGMRWNTFMQLQCGTESTVLALGEDEDPAAPPALWLSCRLNRLAKWPVQAVRRAYDADATRLPAASVMAAQTRVAEVARSRTPSPRPPTTEILSPLSEDSFDAVSVRSLSCSSLGKALLVPATTKHASAGGDTVESPGDAALMVASPRDDRPPVEAIAADAAVAAHLSPTSSESSTASLVSPSRSRPPRSYLPTTKEASNPAWETWGLDQKCAAVLTTLGRPPVRRLSMRNLRAWKQQTLQHARQHAYPGARQKASAGKQGGAVKPRKRV